jgi:hypothetical protein
VIEQFPIARWLYIGKTLGYTEREVWHMTIRKLELLFTEYLKANGMYKKPETIDDLMP